MNFWIGIIISIAFLAATIIIFATRFLFPHHRTAALIIYAIGWIPFIYSISLRKQKLLHYKETLSSFLSIFWIHIIFGIIMLACLYFLLVLFPIEKSPLLGLEDRILSQRINEDKTLILYLDKSLSDSLEKARSNNLFLTDFKKISNEKKQALKNFWISYVGNLVELDLLKERYKTFYQLNAAAKKTLHNKSFNNGYTSFLTQHYYTLQLTQADKDKNVITFFNEAFPDYGIDSGAYDMLKDKLTDSSELIRLNTGRAYYSLTKDGESKLDGTVKKYLNKIDKSLVSYSKLIAQKPLNFLEKNSFKLWFPIQKELAVNISYIKTATRAYHIDSNLINNYKNRLLSGDILLQRREWHATNVGIPGYWTHSALHIGSLEDMNAYFENLPELEGKSFDQFLQTTYPEAYKKLQEDDKNGNNLAVIESKRPGVILTSLEESAEADCLAVLRVKNTDRSDHFKIAVQALSHFGKPYDFDFDFATDNALVCSELIYKAYLDIGEISIEPIEFNGRLIISPNQFAEKFAKEYNNQNNELNLILFLDGDEKEKTATEKGTDEFVKTWQRPNWHLIKDFINFN